MPEIRTDLFTAKPMAADDKMPDKTKIPTQSHNIIVPEMNKKIDKTRQILAALIFIDMGPETDDLDNYRRAQKKCFHCSQDTEWGTRQLPYPQRDD